eukprot:SAG31_NODE_2414_length_5736_cov_5.853823_1_plen_613_part_00
MKLWLLRLCIVGRAAALQSPRPHSLRQPGLGVGGGADAPLPPFSPPLPAQFPRKFVVENFLQPVDHFNLLQPVDPNTHERVTFKQRLLFHNESWGGAGSPVIFYTGAEGNGVDTIWDHSGWIIEELARNLSALVVFAEHRFFGQSQPWGGAACELAPTFNGSCESSFWPNATRLGLLSEEQALHDFAMVASALRDELPEGWASPFITVGGSLAGEISTWFRIRYPHLIDMALASSAPILGYPGLSDPNGWYRVVTNAFDSVCKSHGYAEVVDHIRDGNTMLRHMTPAQLSSAFNTCTPAKKWCDYQVIAGRFNNWAGGAAESAYPPAYSPLDAACKTMKGSTTALEAWQKLMRPAPGQSCLNVTWSPFCYDEDGRPATPPKGDDDGDNMTKTTDGTEKRSDQGGYHGISALKTNGWDYLACTTEVHPIGSNNVTDFLPPQPYNQGSVQRWCQTMFQTFDLNAGGNVGGAESNPAAAGVTQVWMDANQMPKGYPMPLSREIHKYVGTASHIIWSSGSHDPWSAQSVNTSLSDTLLAVIIGGGAHHSDLGGPANPVPDAETDLPSLVKARAFEKATLSRWVAEVKNKRAHFRTSSNSDAASGQAHTPPLPSIRF